MQPENKMQQERLEPKTSSNLSSNTMLSYQLAQQLKLLGNRTNNAYQAITMYIVE